ncbi:MAG: hypothetical protein V7L24_10165 [Nostoc sp.]
MPNKSLLNELFCSLFVASAERFIAPYHRHWLRYSAFGRRLRTAGDDGG